MLNLIRKGREKSRTMTTFGSPKMGRYVVGVDAAMDYLGVTSFHVVDDLTSLMSRAMSSPTVSIEEVVSDAIQNGKVIRKGDS